MIYRIPTVLLVLLAKKMREVNKNILLEIHMETVLIYWTRILQTACACIHVCVYVLTLLDNYKIMQQPFWIHVKKNSFWIHTKLFFNITCERTFVLFNRERMYATSRTHSTSVPICNSICWYLAFLYNSFVQYRRKRIGDQGVFIFSTFIALEKALITLWLDVIQKENCS